MENLMLPLIFPGNLVFCTSGTQRDIKRFFFIIFQFFKMIFQIFSFRSSCKKHNELLYVFLRLSAKWKEKKKHWDMSTWIVHMVERGIPVAHVRRSGLPGSSPRITSTKQYSIANTFGPHREQKKNLLNFLFNVKC